MTALGIRESQAVISRACIVDAQPPARRENSEAIRHARRQTCQRSLIVDAFARLKLQQSAARDVELNAICRSCYERSVASNGDFWLEHFRSKIRRRGVCRIAPEHRRALLHGDDNPRPRVGGRTD